MNLEQQPDSDDDQPVAYDTEGRPLFYRPEPAIPAPSTITAEKTASYLPPDWQVRHDDSVERYPEIQFSDTEYVVIDVQRSIWGLIFIWLAAMAAFVVILLFAFTMVSIAHADPFTMFMIVSTLGVMCLVGGAIGQYVFHQNFFVVTSERIFQRIQTTPFAYRTQNIELERIEDASYRQYGPLQIILNYGTLRFSTISEEQTYRFTFVTRPVEQFQVINKLIHDVEENSYPLPNRQ